MARIEIPEGPGPDIHRVWLLRPEMAVGAGALADAVYAKSQLPPRVREAARMAVAQRNECQVCLGWRDPSLAEAGVSLLTIHNRTGAKAQEMLTRLREAYPGVEMQVGSSDPTGHDLVVNATSLGMAPGDPYPLDVEALQSTQIVAEIIMRPEMTPLLVAAQGKNCRIQLGMPMLAAQVELMARFMGAL